MSDKKTSAGFDAGAQVKGFLDHAYKSGIGAAEDIHKSAFEIPITILEGMGAPKDKVDMLREKSDTLIGELYTAINAVAEQVSQTSAAGVSGVADIVKGPGTKESDSDE